MRTRSREDSEKLSAIQPLSTIVDSLVVMTELESTLSTSQIEDIVLGVNKRRKGADSKFLFGAERIGIKYRGSMKFLARKNQFELPIDEPADRGGDDSGPNPLAYFLTGCASCLMMQYVRLAIASKIQIDFFEMVAIAHFDRNVGGGFTEMIYEIAIESKEGSEKIADLAKEAESFCYVHNTLLKAGVKISTKLKLNGNEIATPFALDKNYPSVHSAG